MFLSNHPLFTSRPRRSKDPSKAPSWFPSLCEPLGRLRPLVGVGLSLLVLLGGWAWGRSAEAATVLFLSEEAMIRASSLIVEGQILRQDVRALGPRKRLVTESLVFVRRFLKGETASRLLTVRTMGGQDKVRLQIVSGEASLRPGQHVILFLSPTPATPWERSPTSFVSVAMAWGVFYVRPHPTTKVIVVERPRDLPHQMRPLEGGRLQAVSAFSHPAPVDRSVFLHDLKLRIQKLHPPASSLPLRQAEARPLDSRKRGGPR